MKSPGENDSSDNTLRAQVEAWLAQQSQQHARQPSDAELRHELQVHQVELELQNEALQQAHAALERSRNRYKDLYEFAPVGYITLSSTGVIDDINLTSVKQLGICRAMPCASAPSPRW